MIPIFFCAHMREAIRFYTSILGFRKKYETDQDDDAVVDLEWNGIELQLTNLPGNQKAGFAVNVKVESVDDLYHQLVRNGLILSGRAESPVHQSPVDQTWGNREFYVTDLDGNTLRFFSRLDG